MDLDTIIYIVAVVVTFVVSLLGQKKKKKKNMPVQSETETVEYSLNDFEKILQRKEEFQQVQEINKEEIPIENSYELEETQDDLQTIEEDIDVKKAKRKEDKKKNSQKDEKEDGFDLNSAIIYSSILERKKFRH